VSYNNDELSHETDDDDDDDDVVWPTDARRRSLPRVLSQLLQGDDIPRTTAQD